MDAEITTFVCPYNMDVDCDALNCERCGWYPPVEQSRKEALKDVKLYRVPFIGFCEVWARSPEEAATKADDIKQQFYAQYDYGDPVCLEKEAEYEDDS